MGAQSRKASKHMKLRENPLTDTTTLLGDSRVTAIVTLTFQKTNGC